MLIIASLTSMANTTSCKQGHVEGSVVDINSVEGIVTVAGVDCDCWREFSVETTVVAETVDITYVEGIVTVAGVDCDC